MIASPSRKIPKPWNWCRTASVRPRTPKVNRRLAAVLPTAVSASARKFASWAPATVCSSTNSTQVDQGADDADRCEPDQLPGHTGRHTGGGRLERGPAELPAHLRERQCATGQRPTDPCDSLQVVLGGADDVDPGIRVVDPIHRHLVNAQPAALGEDQQLGVEKPPVVLHQRQQLLRHVGPDRLEPALRVGEMRGQRAAQDQVVATGDELPLRVRGSPVIRGAAGYRSRCRNDRRSTARPAATGRRDRWRDRRPYRPAPRRPIPTRRP